MRTVWRRISMDKMNKLIKKHNLSFIEQEILKRLRKGVSQRIIADETTYSICMIEKYVKGIYEKVKDEL